MASTFPTQQPLNLVMPIAAGALPSLVAALKPAPGGADPLHTALTRLGNVHFAQFLFLENNTRLGVFTIFDGEFDDYIVSFVEHIGDIFNAILAHIDGAAGLIPVQEHRDEFLAFIRAHDLQGLGEFSAYPDRRVFDIKDALEIR